MASVKAVVLVVVGMLLTSGCASLLYRTSDADYVERAAETMGGWNTYPATRMDFLCILASSREAQATYGQIEPFFTLAKLCMVVDIPFSLLLDTAFYVHDRRLMRTQAEDGEE